MNLFKRIRREFLGGLAGIREGVVDLAERVNEKMRVVKLSLDIQDVEQVLEEQYIRMGERTYQLKDHIMEEMESDDELGKYAVQISQLQERVSDLETQLGFLRVGGLKGRLMEWREDLQHGRLTIDSVTISPTAPVVGKALMDLKFPPGIIPLTIVHKNQILLPKGEMVLYEGDRITFLCQEEEVEEGRRVLMG